MRIGLWSTSADWRLARRIGWDGWTLRRRADLPGDINLKLEKALRQSLPRNEKDYKKLVLSVHSLLRQGIACYQTDFKAVEDIKHNAEIIESSHIKRLDEFEKLVDYLRQDRRLDEITAHATLKQIREVRGKLKSELVWDKSRESRLKWSV